MTKDTIFDQEGSGAFDFNFNENVARVFDDMVVRSIPLYLQLQDLVVNVIDKHSVDGPVVYDIGSSTAYTMRLLYKHFISKGANDFKLVGFDNSSAMIKQANTLFANERFDKTKIECKEADILQMPAMDNATAVISLFTLQFIRPIEREKILHHIYNSIKPGGVFIMAEKTVSKNPTLNRSFIDLYHNYKKKNGYSDTEVAAKREALENVLIPFQDNENLSILESVGFKECEIIMKWLNFSCYVALK